MAATTLVLCVFRLAAVDDNGADLIRNLDLRRCSIQECVFDFHPVSFPPEALPGGQGTKEPEVTMDTPADSVWEKTWQSTVGTSSSKTPDKGNSVLYVSRRLSCASQGFEIISLSGVVSPRGVKRFSDFRQNQKTTGT